MSDKVIAYHGSVWERPLLPDEQFVNEAAFFDLDVNKNDLKALFVSNNQSVSDGFSRIKFIDSENQLQVMIKVEVDTEKTVRKSFELGRSTEYNGELYNYSCDDDRERLYDNLRSDGINCFVMENDYETSKGGGDDIAILDNSACKSLSVKLKIDGEWTKDMSYDDAKDIMKKWAMGDLEVSSGYDSNRQENDFQFGY